MGVRIARADALLAAVQRIHEAALETGGWAEILPSLAGVLDSQHVVLFEQDPATRSVVSIGAFGIASKPLAGFVAAHEAGLAPPGLATISPGLARRSSEFHSDRAFARCWFYNEVVRPIGAFYALAASLFRGRERNVYCILARQLGREDFSPEEVAAMQLLVPHLVMVMRVRALLDTTDLRSASAGIALDMLGAGLILVDAAAKVRFANRLAEDLLARNDGLSLDRGCICALDSRALRSLHRLIAQNAASRRAASTTGGNVSVPRSNGRAPLQVLVAPASLETDRSRMARLGAVPPAAILIITDPDREQLMRKEQLRQRFGLTPAEIGVAIEIVKGDGRGAVAARLGISMTTVRTHLSHIFDKTGVRRQAELVRLLTNGQYGTDEQGAGAEGGKCRHADD